MLTKRNFGLVAAVAAAFIAMTFAPATEAVAAPHNVTFNRYVQDSQAKQQTATRNVQQKTVNSTTSVRVQKSVHQQAANEVQTQTVQRKTHLGGFTVTHKLLGELAKTNPGLHARIFAAGNTNSAIYVTHAEAQLIRTLAVRSQQEIKAAGADIAVPVATLALILIDVIVKMNDPEFKTPFGMFWRPLSCAIATFFQLKGYAESNACKPVAGK